MESLQPIISSDTTHLVIQFTDRKQGTTPLQLSTISIYIDIGTTSSLVLEPLYTAKYTIDFNGTLVVNSMDLFMFSFNDVNARSVLQVSGDGGNNFVDITDEIPDGIDAGTVGNGLWINSIKIGTDGLQFRVLGRSTDGNPATVRLDQGSSIGIIIVKN